MSIESIVKELTEQEIDKYRPQIEARVKKEIDDFIKSAKGKKMIQNEAENCLMAYFENESLTDFLGRAEIVKLAKRAFKV